LGLLLFAAAATWGSAASAECVAPPPPDPAPAAAAAPTTGARLETAIGETQIDAGKRVVAPVSINGQGPFRFIVDTGANRSVLSQQLADRLGLSSRSSGPVNSIEGVTIAPFVEVSSVSYRGIGLPSDPLPVLAGRMFAGEQGLLGVDGMQGRRLLIDIEHGCVEITASRNAPRLFGWTTIHGQLRFGDLVVAPGRIHGVRVNIIIDTGSDASLANIALRDAVSAPIADDPQHANIVRAYTAGLPVALQGAVAVPTLEMGELTVSHVFAYVGDFHVFQLWGLTQEPTLLLGMDVISQVRGVAIDYGRSIVQFKLAQERQVGLVVGHSAMRSDY